MGPGGRALGQGCFGQPSQQPERRKNKDLTPCKRDDYKRGTLHGRNGGVEDTSQIEVLGGRQKEAKGENQSLVLNLGKKGRGTSKAVASFAAAFKQHKLRSQEPTAVDKKQKNWHGGKQPVFSCIYFYLKPPDQGAET